MKMERIRSVQIFDNKVTIFFEFDRGIIDLVKDIPGRKWEPDLKAWTLPATPWHYDKVVEALLPLGFTFDPEILQKADRKDMPKPGTYLKGLYHYQKVGVDFMYDVGGRAIIADQMGLGKTIETLAFMDAFCGETLVVCPASVVYKWEGDCHNWLPGCTTQVVTTGKDVIGGADIIIMSYAIMVSHYETLKDMPFDLVVYDEAHALKGRKSQRARVGRALVKGGIPKVLFLSGTPFLNRPDELFPLLNMLDPVGFANFYQYAKRYMGAEYIQGMWYFPPGVVTNREELAHRLKRIMLRRTVDEVAIDLPDLTRTIIPVELTNTAAYKKALKDVRTWLKDKDRTVLNPAHALTRLNVLRQIVGEGKAKAGIELAESVLQDGKKVVLFAHHKDVVKLLADGLDEHGVLLITGEVSQKERSSNIKEFLSKDSSSRVMIITVAGAEGIDLYSASDIIFVEREWTPAREEQAEARLHRIGQKSPVTAHYLVAKKTVDEKLARIIKEKRAVIGQVISQDEILELVLDEVMEA